MKKYEYTTIPMTDKQVLINGNAVDKATVAKMMGEWARSNFIFNSGAVHMPYDSPHPISEMSDELLSADVFKQLTGLGALEYMLFTAFLAGLKSGKEVELNDGMSSIYADEQVIDHYVRNFAGELAEITRYSVNPNGEKYISDTGEFVKFEDVVESHKKAFKK